MTNKQANDILGVVMFVAVAFGLAFIAAYA